MRLKTLLARHGITQTELARILKRDKSVVTNLMQGKRHLKADEAALISQVLGVPVAEILGLEEFAIAGVAETTLIPFQHTPVKARDSRQVIKRDGKFYLSEQTSFTEKAFALEVRDDSLNLSGILPGDIVISELDRPVKSGQVVVVQHYGGASAQTLLRKYEPPFLLPHSTNHAHKPLPAEGEEVRVVSPVIKLVRMM